MRAVVTVTGTDKRGIIAKVSGFLAERDINIEDISQTILGDRFVMIMIVETAQGNTDFVALAKEMEELGKGIGMNVRLQHEGLFNAMHAI